ncbi:MAG TPA: tetratricopeptide repeat protein [Terriglobia bacterium]|nr:tetratricopeptide repeat protein [Terriglobia bacterium]
MEKPSRREVLSRMFHLTRAPDVAAEARIRLAGRRRAGARPEPEAPRAQAAARPASGAVRGRSLLITALLACATLPYLNMLFNAFVYDDHTQVTNNPYLQNVHHLKDIFTTTVWSYVGAQGVTNYYRPMMTLGYLACYRLFGPLAYGFHLASLLLHVLVVCLVFALTERLTGNRVWAFVAGALFALHPVHTESVAWIAAVTDLELTFFFLLTFGLFVGAARPDGQRSSGMIAAMVAAFVFALLSKEQALTLPALAAVYEHFYRDDRARTRAVQKLARYGPLWLVATAYLAFRIRFLGALAPVHQMRAVTPSEVVLSALALVGQYLGKLLWPWRLCAFYVFHPSTAFHDPRVLAGLLALAALAALFAGLWRSREPAVRFASFGIVWFLATLAPVLNSHWMAANVFAERYLYLPSVGFCWLAGLAGTRLWAASGLRTVRAAGARRPAVAAAGATLALLLAARIVVRNRDWSNDIVLYHRTLALQPDAYPILNNLGTVYWQNGAVDEAERVWRRALALHPENAIVLNNLGLVAERRQRHQAAVDLFRRAMRLKPNYTDPHLNLGEAYRSLGLTGPAELQLRAAVALSPLNTRARNELGRLLFDQGRLAGAEEQFRASVSSEPTAVAYDFLGELALGRGDAQPAERAFQAALVLNSIDSKAHFGLGRLYAAAGRNPEALRQYQAGLLDDPTDAPAQAAVRELQSRSTH